MENLKYSVWAIWVGGAAAILFGSGAIYVAGHIAVWLTLIAHVVEFLVKRPVFEQAGGTMGHHFLQTMIYGLFHWKPIEERLAAGSAPSDPT
jgi:hypothetical protein